jgi:hypothetical protein
MKMMKWIAIILTMIGLASCTAVEPQQSQQDKAQEIADKNRAAMDSWLGAHKSELIAQLGPPDRVTSNGLDGEILIYETSFTISGSAGWVGYGGYIYGASPPTTYTRMKSFWVDGSGKIYHWKLSTR